MRWFKYLLPLVLLIDAFGQQVTLTPTSLSFNNQTVNVNSTFQDVQLLNSDPTVTLNITSISLDSPALGFTISNNTCGSTLVAGAACTVAIKFDPAAVGTVSINLNFVTNAPSSPDQVSLQGTGVTNPNSSWLPDIAPTRAIDWTTAGVLGITGGVPSTNWTQCGTTVASGASAATVNAAIAACGTNQYVLLSGTVASPATYNFTTGLIMKKNVELRGGGPNATFISFTAGVVCGGEGAEVCFLDSNGQGYGSTSVEVGGTNSATWCGTGSSGTCTNTYNFGATTIQLTGIGSGGIINGQWIYLDQNNDNPTNPSVNATTGFLVCDNTSSTDGCSLEGGAPGRCSVGPGGGAPSCSTGGAVHRNQVQIVQVLTGCATTCTGGTTGAPKIVTIAAPGVYGQNWRTSQAPGAWWSTNGAPTSSGSMTNAGITNMSVDTTNVNNSNYYSAILFMNAFDCWVSNITLVKSPHAGVWLWQASHITVQNSYFYGTQTTTQQSYGVEPFIASDYVVINNIFQQVTSPNEMGPSTGGVWIYNFSVSNPFTPPSGWMQQAFSFRHDAGVMYNLSEGNISNGYFEDVFHGSGGANTIFRNYAAGFDFDTTVSPAASKTEDTVPIQFYSYNRYDNVLGNVLGCNNGTNSAHYDGSTVYPGNCGSPYHTSYQVVGGAGTAAAIYALGSGNTETSTTVLADSYVSASLLRWGNYDVKNAAARFVNSEVPSTLTDGYANPIPGSHVLPSSYVLTVQPSTWVFPGGTAYPWPGIGPDVTGGNIPGLSGHAYYNPAANCYFNQMSGPQIGTGTILTYPGEGVCYKPASGPAVSLNPTSMNFGGVNTGVTSSAITSTLTNTGGATLTISSITITGTNSADYGQTNTCGSSVGAGANCTISVTFTPSATGTRTASVSIADNATGSPQTISLTGTGTTPATPAVTLSQTSIAFGNQATGTTSGATVVTLTNTGTATLTISSIVASSHFGVSNTCGGSVTSGNNCTISVTFSPVSAGSQTGTVTITDNASTSPQTISLTGNGVAGSLSFAPNPLNFPNQIVNTSNVLSVTINNTGGTTITLTQPFTIIGSNPGQFNQGNNCGTSLAAGSSCIVNVIFAPLGTAVYTANLHVVSSISTTNVVLNGTGVVATGTTTFTGGTGITTWEGLDSQVIPASYFGLHVNGGTGNWPPSQGFTSFGTLRLWDNGSHVAGNPTQWATSYVSGSGLGAVYSFTNLNSWLSLMKTQCGLVGGNCSIIMPLGRTPQSMSAYPLETGCGYQTDGHGQCYPPIDIVGTQSCWVNSGSCTSTTCYTAQTCNDDITGSDNNWKGWVTALTTDISGLSSSYQKTNIIFEPWNEVTSDLASSAGGQWYDRTQRAQEVKLATDASTIIKANQGALAWYTISPNTTTWNPANVPGSHAVTQEQQRLFAVSGLPQAVQGISFHGYTSNAGIPEETSRIMTDPTYGMRSPSIMGAQAGTTYPMFMSEVAWGTGCSLLQCTDPDNQKAFVARLYLLGWGFGASSISWYTWDLNNGAQLWQSTSSGNCTTAITTGFLCPAGVAYQAMYTWMKGSTQIGPCSGPFGPAAVGVWTCQFKNSAGFLQLAVWDASQTCSGGTCTTSTFIVPAGYGTMATIEAPTTFSSIGSTVQIGIKPVLLSNPNPALSGENIYCPVQGSPSYPGGVTTDGPAILPTDCNNTDILNTPTESFTGQCPGTSGAGHITTNGVCWVGNSSGLLIPTANSSDFNGNTTDPRANGTNTVDYSSIGSALLSSVGVTGIHYKVLATTNNDGNCSQLTPYNENVTMQPGTVAAVGAWNWMSAGAYNQLPPEFSRITPAWAGQTSIPGFFTYTQPNTPGCWVPTVVGQQQSTPELQTDPTTQYWRFVGMGWTNKNGMQQITYQVGSQAGSYGQLVLTICISTNNPITGCTSGNTVGTYISGSGTAWTFGQPPAIDNTPLMINNTLVTTNHFIDGSHVLLNGTPPVEAISGCQTFNAGSGQLGNMTPEQAGVANTSGTVAFSVSGDQFAGSNYWAGLDGYKFIAINGVNVSVAGISYTVSAGSCTGTGPYVCTITLSGTNGMVSGNTVALTANGLSAAGGYTITNVNPGANQISYSQTATPGTFSTSPVPTAIPGYGPVTGMATTQGTQINVCWHHPAAMNLNSTGGSNLVFDRNLAWGGNDWSNKAAASEVGFSLNGMQNVSVVDSWLSGFWCGQSNLLPSITAGTSSGTGPYTITLTVSSITGLAVNQTITLTGVGISANGNYVITAVGTNTISYSQSAAPGTFTAGTGKVTLTQCVEGKAVGGGTGSVPLKTPKIVNDLLEGSSEDAFLAGAQSGGSPTDGEYRLNHFYKRLVWNKFCVNPQIAVANIVGNSGAGTSTVTRVTGAAGGVYFRDEWTQIVYSGTTYNVIGTPSQNLLTISGVVTASNATIQVNHLPSICQGNIWDGIIRNVKNSEELKAANRFLFEANIWENAWQGQSDQTGILFNWNQFQNANDAFPGESTINMTMRYSLLIHGNRCFGSSSYGALQGPMNGGQGSFSLHDFLCDDINAAKWGLSTGGQPQVGGVGLVINSAYGGTYSANNITANHFTLIQSTKGGILPNTSAGNTFGWTDISNYTPTNSGIGNTTVLANGIVQLTSTSGSTFAEDGTVNAQSILLNGTTWCQILEVTSGLTAYLTPACTQGAATGITYSFQCRGSSTVSCKAETQVVAPWPNIFVENWIGTGTNAGSISSVKGTLPSLNALASGNWCWGPGAAITNQLNAQVSGAPYPTAQGSSSCPGNSVSLICSVGATPTLLCQIPSYATPLPSGVGFASPYIDGDWWDFVGGHNDYTLQGTSPFHNAGTDGFDLGVNIGLLKLYLKGVY